MNALPTTDEAIRHESVKEKAANKIDGDTDSIDMVFLEHLRHKFKSDAK